MPRYMLIVEYDGGPFVGWQRQDNGPSVQGAIENAVKAFCGADVVAFAAGRTDAGVHALAMPAQFDLPFERPEDTVRDALNAHLRPAPIVILSARRVADDFHVRFSALSRRYLYRIVNRRAPLALDAGRAWQLPQKLDAQAMGEAARRLVGRHDFSTFRAAQCQAASPVKTLSALTVSRDGEEVRVQASAPSFLHSQVRSMVGTLVEVGLGRWTPDDVSAALEARDRARCGQVAPACGLYFLGTDYPTG
ncbi:MAG: tRNA pseudouridine(38-40) synthase TruA [Pseudomonadota bacterium]|nr:tRNA pseudouridine(38-40) synthase TruA [Pseudomonadota bacterium]